MLTAMTMDTSGPFYRLGTVRFIGRVPEDDFVVFLRQLGNEPHSEVTRSVLHANMVISELGSSEDAACSDSRGWWSSSIAEGSIIRRQTSLNGTARA
jgi:hypothetical protein